MKHPNDILADILRAELDCAKEIEAIANEAIDKMRGARHKRDRTIELVTYANEKQT